MTTEQNKSTEQHRNFTILTEKGPFSIKDVPNAPGEFMKNAKSWIRELDSESRTKFTAMRSLVFQLLDVKSFPEIQNVIYNEERKNQLKDRAYGLIGQMYGIEGTTEEVRLKIDGYAKTADSVINKLREKELATFYPELEMVNEITNESNPIELLAMVFNKNVGRQAKFEAKRKLVLMNLAASIDQRERETKNEIKFKKFEKFLKDYVWEGKVGDTEKIYLLSEHVPETFACIPESIKKLNEEERKDITVKEGQKLTMLSRRRFKVNEIETPIYVTIRRKSTEAEILKLLRKGQENPSIAVDDDLGFFAVVEDKSSMDRFQKLLVQSATKAGSSMIFEEISDSIDEKDPHKIPERKFHVKTGGMRVEFILHTNETYLDHLYQDYISHDEYEVRRLFDKEVPQLLAPESIYGVKWGEAEPRIIKQVRNRIRT